MTDLPKTYKAAVFEKKGEKLAIRDIELKKPAPGYVLVKVLAAGVCHSDLIVQEGAIPGQFPRIPGHEIVGDVAAIPEGEKKWKTGDRVGGAWHGGHDNTCKNCQRGLFQMCSAEKINGVTMDGGYAEYVHLRTEAVVSVPRDVDPASYSPILCAGVTVFNSIRKLNLIAGETVAIQGLGGLGHLAVQYVSKMGFKTVVISTSGSKREFAKQLGANEYIDTSKEDVTEALNKLGGAVAIVATAPNPKIIAPLINGLQAGGKLLVLALAGKIEIDTMPLVTKAISVSGYPTGHALDCEEAIEFAQRTGVNCLVEKFSLDQANEAYERMLSGHVRFRSVIVM